MTANKTTIITIPVGFIYCSRRCFSSFSFCAFIIIGKNMVTNGATKQHIHIAGFN